MGGGAAPAVAARRRPVAASTSHCPLGRLPGNPIGRPLAPCRSSGSAPTAGTEAPPAANTAAAHRGLAPRSPLPTIGPITAASCYPTLRGNRPLPAIGAIYFTTAHRGAGTTTAAASPTPATATAAASPTPRGAVGAEKRGALHALPRAGIGTVGTILAARHSRMHRPAAAPNTPTPASPSPTPRRPPIAVYLSRAVAVGNGTLLPTRCHRPFTLCPSSGTATPPCPRAAPAAPATPTAPP